MSPLASKEKPPGLVEENESHENNLQREKAEKDAFLDPCWLSSLSDPQLDMLVYLKQLVIRQAQNAGCEDLVKEFDGKTIRGLGSILFTYFKERMREVSLESADSYRPLEDFKLPLHKRENLRQTARVEDPGLSNVSALKRKREEDG